MHAHAVDYAKTGYQPPITPNLMTKQFPDFMEKKEKDNIYESTSILGIYH